MPLLYLQTVGGMKELLSILVEYLLFHELRGYLR